MTAESSTSRTRSIAPVVLPHLHDRPLTLKRYPNGVEEQYFYEKQSPSHRPDWVATAQVQGIEYTLVQDRPTLFWLANLADLELHTSLSLAGAPERPTMLVFDLGPGAPAGILWWWVLLTMLDTELEPPALL